MSLMMESKENYNYFGCELARVDVFRRLYPHLSDHFKPVSVAGWMDNSYENLKVKMGCMEEDPMLRVAKNECVSKFVVSLFDSLRDFLLFKMAHGGNMSENLFNHEKMVMYVCNDVIKRFNNISIYCIHGLIKFVVEVNSVYKIIIDDLNDKGMIDYDFIASKMEYSLKVMEG